MSTIKERRPAVEGWFTSSPIRLLGTRCGDCGTPYFPRNELACRNPACTGRVGTVGVPAVDPRHGLVVRRRPV